MLSWVAKTIRGARKVPWAKVLAAIAWLTTEGREYWNRLTAAERRDQTAHCQIAISRPITPTIIRIRPTVRRSSPSTWKCVAKRRIAPTAIRKRDVPKAMPGWYPTAGAAKPR